MGRPAQPTQSGDRIYTLANNISVVRTVAGDVLVNSPPETLKYLLSEGISVPTIILLPPDMPPGRQLGSSGFVHQGICYASIEFPVYSNFFGNNGRRTLLITVSEHQAQRLRRILDETIRGPTDPDAYGPYGWVMDECAAVSLYPPLGRPLDVDDMVDIVSLERGGGELGPVSIRLEEGAFIFSEYGVDVATLSAAITEPPMPLTLTPPRPLLRQELTLQFVGGSHGFDPAGITTCFLAYFGDSSHTQATLFDAAAYLRVRLGSMGISVNQISEVVLSHLHEDHLAGLPELILMGNHRVKLITSDLVYRGLLRVLGAMLDLPATEVETLIDYVPLNPGRPVEVEGRVFEAIYAIHSIPTIAVRVKGLCYSGDMRYDEAWFSELEASGVLSPARRAELTGFAEGVSLLVQDAGGGTIHTTLTPAVLQALTAKSRRLILAHTSTHQLPVDKHKLPAAVEFAGSGHIVAVGDAIERSPVTDTVETLAACPLFARLSTAERLTLAEQMTLTHWSNNEIIAHEGDPSEGQTYVIHAGLVEIWRNGERSRILGRGTSIGERSALHGQPRSGTMKAHGQVQLLRLDAAGFAPIAKRMGLHQAIDRADWLSRQPAFAPITWSALLDLALDFEQRQYLPDERLFSAGEFGDESFLLIDGTISITDTSGCVIDTLTVPGTFFGGRAALFGKLRNASAHATQPSECWALPTTALRRLHIVYPGLVLHLRAVESARGPH
jgi:CRP-like cAMP-binding protein/ribonuclease BN (tRNA processing enzyme)